MKVAGDMVDGGGGRRLIRMGSRENMGEEIGEEDKQYFKELFRKERKGAAQGKVGLWQMGGSVSVLLGMRG